MIATILPGSTNFHAVGYNEHKVSQGVAQLIEMKNFGSIGVFSQYTAAELVKYLTDYSSRNDRIKKAQFHAAISCKGHEYTEQQLLEFAHQYLKEMGYGEEGQPLLVYAHRDTDNTHIHIITSRIAPNGKKIDHNHERRRSQEIVAKLMGQNLDAQAHKDIEAAKAYSFSKLPQFKAILSSMGYEVYDKDGTVSVKKGGKVRIRMPESEISTLYRKDETDKKRLRQLKMILLKYRDISNNKEELQKELKKKFGLDLIFFGPTDSPSGYTIIDHNNKEVIAGSQALRIKSLLDFTSPEDKLKQINTYIEKLISENQKITTHDIYCKIRKRGAWIKKGVLHYGSSDQTKDLTEEIRTKLQRNDKINTVEKFRPSSKEECAMLCKIFKIEDAAEMVDFSPEPTTSYLEDELQEMFEIFEGSALRAEIRGAGYALRKDSDQYFAINFTTKKIVHLSPDRFPVEKLWLDYIHAAARRELGNKRSHKPGGNLMPKDKSSLHRGDSSGSASINREWEISQDNKDMMDNRLEGESLKY